jgi:hypothetical protein
MNRSLPSCRILASLLFSLGLVGCGSEGVETGMPRDPKKVDIPLDPKMVDVTGKMTPGAAKKAAAGAETTTKGQPAPAPESAENK